MQRKWYVGRMWRRHYSGADYDESCCFFFFLQRLILAQMLARYGPQMSGSVSFVTNNIIIMQYVYIYIEYLYTYIMYIYIILMRFVPRWFMVWMFYQKLFVGDWKPHPPPPFVPGCGGFQQWNLEDTRLSATDTANCRVVVSLVM